MKLLLDTHIFLLISVVRYGMERVPPPLLRKHLTSKGHRLKLRPYFDAYLIVLMHYFK